MTLPSFPASCIYFTLSRSSLISCHTAPAYLEYRASFLQCACSPGWIGEFCQYVGDACLIKPNSCLNGATCITMSQPSAPPQYTCRCPLGFTGKVCVLCFLFSCFCAAVCLAVHWKKNMDRFAAAKPRGEVVYGAWSGGCLVRSQFSAGLEQRDIMKAGFRFSPPHYKNVVDGGNAIFTLSHDSVRDGDRHSFPEQIWQRRWKNDI